MRLSHIDMCQSMSVSTPEPIGRRIAALGILTIVAYGSWFYGFGVLLGDIRADLDSSDRTLAVGFGLAQFGSGALGVVAGRTLDRRSVRPLFVVGAILGGGLLAASTLATTPWPFAITFGVAGGVIGSTGFYGITQTVAARLAPGRETKAIALLTIWGALSSPLFIPATEAARRWWGWRVALRLDAVLVAAAFLATAAFADPERRSAASRPSARTATAVRRAIADPDVRRLTSSAMSASAAVSILLVYQVSIMVAVGLTAGTASALAGARGFAQLLGRVPLTVVVARAGVRTSLLAARVALAVGCGLIVFSEHPVVAIVYVVVAGTSIGALSPLDGIYARSTLPADDLGALMGALALLTGTAGALGPVLGAAVVDATGDRTAAAMAAAGFALLGAWLLRPGGGRRRSGPDAARPTDDSTASSTP